MQTTILGQPLWLWAVIIGGGIVLYLFIRRKTTTSGSTLGQSGTQAVNPLNPGNDPNIDPNTGVPYSLEEAIDPATGVPYYYENQPASGGTTGTVSSGGSNTPISIRSSEASGGQFQQWDSAHPGVPIEPNPVAQGATTYASFGTQVPTTGPAVQGQPNYGSTKWYPVQGGYVSAVDVVGGSAVSQGYAPTGTMLRIGSAAPRHQATPWWPYDLTRN